MASWQQAQPLILNTTSGRAADTGIAPRFAGHSVASFTATQFETPEYNASWGLRAINAAEAYARGFTGKNVLVAVIDSGLDVTHPEFDGRISPWSRNFGYDGRSPDDLTDTKPNGDVDGHGTHVSGTIAAARDGIGMHGVAYNAQILALRAIVDGAGGNELGAIDHAVAHGAKVLNGSYGPSYPEKFLPGGVPNPQYVELPAQPLSAEAQHEYNALKRAADADMVLVYAAGNDRADQPIVGQNPSGIGLYPYIRPENANKGIYVFLDANYNEIDGTVFDFSGIGRSLITVMAVDSNNRPAVFSNYCGVAAAWCMAAPGVDVPSTYPVGYGAGPNNGYTGMSGTSMAAPHVAGAAAVLREAFPFMTAPEIVQTLLTTATDIGPREIYGWGLLNLGKAVRGPGQFAGVFDVDTKGHDSRFANDIGGTGGLIKRGAGTLQLTGFNSYQGGTAVLGGTLALNGSLGSQVLVGAGGTLRGTGHIGAPLTVAGQLRPGNSPGTLTVAGPVSMTAGSLFAPDIDGPGTGTGAGNHSRLLVTGPTGSFTAGGQFAPVLRGITGDASNRFVPTLGERLTVASASQGIQGSFTGLVQPAAGMPAGSRFDAIYGFSNLDLVLTPQAYANLGVLGIAQNGNQAAVGAALDAVRPAAGTRPDARIKDAFDALYSVGTPTMARTLASLSGQVYGDAVVADLAGQRLISRTIDRRLTTGGGAGATLREVQTQGAAGVKLDARAGASAAATQPAPGEGRLWGEALYGFGTRGHDARADGSRYDAGGLMIGADRQVGANTLVGGAAGYLRTDGKGRGGNADSFDIDSYNAILYGRTEIANVAVRGALGAAYTHAGVDRTVMPGTWMRRAVGKASGYDLSAFGMVGYRFALGGFELVPEAGLAYNYLQRDGLRESGAGALSLDVRGSDFNAMRSLVGGRMSTQLTTADKGGLKVDVSAYWSHELMDNVAVSHASLLGAGFATRTAEASRDGAVLGASLSGTIAPGVSLSVNYSGEIRNKATDHSFSAGLRAVW